MNLTLTDTIDMTEANQLWSRVWEQTGNATSWGRVEGYMAEVMHFASQVPERIGNGALAQSTIALVATLRQQISDRVIGIFD